MSRRFFSLLPFLLLATSLPPPPEFRKEGPDPEPEPEPGPDPLALPKGHPSDWTPRPEEEE